MTFELLGFHHVNVTVPQALEETTKHFYGVVLGSETIAETGRLPDQCGGMVRLGRGCSYTSPSKTTSTTR